MRASKDQDFRDLQNEMAGVDTGRQKRFLTADQREEQRLRRSGQSRSQQSMSRLQALLASNPAYAKLYNDTMDKLRDAERAVERAIEQAIHNLKMAKDRFQDTLDRAARLPNGTRVFKDEQDQVWTEHGQRVGKTEADSIVWREDAPGYQEFLDNREAVEDRFTNLGDLQGVQIDLGDIRNRMEDNERPPSVPVLKGMGEQIDEIKTKANHYVLPSDEIHRLPNDAEATTATAMTLRQIP